MLSQQVSIDRRSFVSQLPVTGSNYTVPQDNFVNLPQHVAIDMPQQPVLTTHTTQPPPVINHSEQQAAEASQLNKPPPSNNETTQPIVDEAEKPLVEGFRHKWKRRIKSLCKNIGYGMYHRKNGRKIFCGLACTEWCKLFLCYNNYILFFKSNNVPQL